MFYNCTHRILSVSLIEIEECHVTTAAAEISKILVDGVE